MRLIIAFSHDLEFSADDIVISYVKPSDLKEEQFIKTELSGNFDYTSKIEEFRTNFFLKQPSTLLRDVLKSSMNNYNRNWIIPLFSWIETIDKTIATYDFSEIIICGYTNNTGYIPYYEAEGEINNKLLYKSWDAIPVLVEQFLKNKNLKFKIKNRKPLAYLRLRIFIRRYVLLHVKLFIYCVKIFKNVFNNRRKLKDFSTYKYMVFSRGIAHTEYIEQFAVNYDKTILVHAADGVVSGNKNKNYSKSIGSNNFLYMDDALSIKIVLKAYFKILKELFFLKKSSIIINDISINFKSTLKEMLISYFDILVYKGCVDVQIPDSIKKLITCEMYTPYAYVISEIAKQSGRQSAQLQNTAMNMRKEPEYFYCDYFLMNTEENAKILQQLFPHLSSKIKYLGNLSVDEFSENEKNINNDVKKVIYFSQPIIAESDLEESLVKELLRMESSLNFKFYIKPHPRDAVSKFHYVSEEKFISPELTFSQYIGDTDIAIVRTSSIGQQLIIHNIPTIFCLLTDFSRQFKVDYIDKNYFATINQISELNVLFSDYNLLREHFTNFRKAYLKSNGLNLGLHHFYKELEKL